MMKDIYKRADDFVTETSTSLEQKVFGETLASHVNVGRAVRKGAALVTLAAFSLVGYGCASGLTLNGVDVYEGKNNPKLYADSGQTANDAGLQKKGMTSDQKAALIGLGILAIGGFAYAVSQGNDNSAPQAPGRPPVNGK